ncbi:pyridoxamine 5'-phosphate oxidase family protein [Silvibacterium dinghuense]|uniref:Pyridoxamine 5'-phosphate oxidase N-terminal domain-containing protein n=1 Tax=Silvibacterium dinghuense TaxID=1560006 RepID=A0A4Q1SI59_9BACT|nr:hypothetical protein ESZ00_03755 [Silvibacterium dinghuense]
MQQSETVYSAPGRLNGLPSRVLTELDGAHLESRAGEAIRLSTVGEDGWPHAAQLSIGEVLALNPTELLVAIWPESNTAKNLKRDGRLTLSLVSEGGLLEMRGRADGPVLSRGRADSIPCRCPWPRAPRADPCHVPDRNRVWSSSP